MLESNLKEVKNFWNVEPCGVQFVSNATDKKDFIEKYLAFRYATEWHIPLIIPFKEFSGKDVLEIGCGNGADGIMFAKNGAHYTGVDLTEAAMNATREHFSVFSLDGIFKTDNAESLSFKDQSFDLVYSHGVLHHTETPKKAFDEVYRVLKKDGQAIIMLYHKNSFNYMVRILFYMRIRAILKVLLNIFVWTKDRQLLLNRQQGVRGNQDKRVYQIHYENFLRYGWGFFRSTEFAHRCTDGPECPYAFAYSKKELATLFSKFKTVRYEIRHFPIKKYRWGRFIPFKVEEILAKYIGWYLFVFARK